MVKKLLLTLCIFVVLALAAASFLAWQLFNLHREQQSSALDSRKPDISITIIEGKRREEIAQQLQTAGICSYADFMAQSTGLEGTLFPDTYRFFPNTSALEVVNKMEDNYHARTASLNLTPEQLTLASIVEREAKTDTDRTQIAGVYTNRINLGMKLQSDPTVQYSKDSLALAASSNPASFKFWSPITQADYQTANSVYNTYLIPSLPPGPIANPGLKSIQAAQHPATNDDLFFIYKDGTLYLTKTLQEQQALE